MSEPAAPHASAWQVFLVFLRLGVTSFGGPIAHLGYFRAEFVERRRWLDDREFGDLVALCQFLPGPASSQVGFAIELLRAGFRGAFAAFAAFTLPSAALMLAFAAGASVFDGPIRDGVLSGLNVVAVAIVAHAVWGMARTLAPDRSRAGIAIVALLVTTIVAGSIGQIAAIAAGALAGLVLCRPAAGELSVDGGRMPVSRRTGIFCLVALAVLMVAAPVGTALTGDGALALFDAFLRAGALVFGGGHVVLPLLQAGVVDTGWVSSAQFLAGYGAVQAVPGPLFTFAAYLGALADVGPGGVAGAAIALAGIFLPGLLILVGVLPFWNVLRRMSWAQAAMRGASAAVVGILAAALYAPLFVTAITGPVPFALAVLCLALLVSWRLPPWVVVIVGAAGGALIAVL